jgi:hypothetical protein
MAKVPFTQHLDLSRFDAAGLTYRVCQTEFPLQPHTGETRRALKEKSLFFQHVPDERLTHYVDATLNENSVALSMVTQASTLELNGTSYPIDLMMWGSIGIPVQSMRLALADTPQSRTAAATKTIANRLRHLPGVAVSVPVGLSLEEHVQVCADAISYGDALSTAAYFAYQHNAVLHLNADSPYPWYIYDTYVLPANGLDDVVPVLENTTIPWYTVAATVDLAGNAVFDSNNDLVFSQPPTMEVTIALGPALASAINGVRNDPSLEGVKWTCNPGIAVNSVTMSGGTASCALAGKIEDGSGVGWQLGNISSSAGFTCSGLTYNAPSSPTTSGGTLTLQVSNSYLRHMACYLQFSDETNTPIILDDAYLAANGMTGVAGLPSAFSPIDGGTDGTQTYRWLSSIGPVSTCCGVPLPVEPQTITIPLPLNGGVTTINLNFGTAGLSGTGNASTTMAGEILTLLFEMLMPGVLLLVGQAMSDSSIVQQLTSSSEFPVLLGLLAPFMALIGYAWESYDWESFVSTLGSTCVELLFKMLAKVGMSVGAGAGAVLGFAAEWASVAIVGVEVGETTYEIAISPPNYVVSMTMSCDVVVTINPDPDYNIFPAEATSYMVYLTYTTQGSSVTTVLATEQGFLPPTTDSTPVVCTFTDIPAGGAVIPSVVFCASNGWIAGQGVGAAIDTWQASSGNSFTVDGSITIATNPVPLNSDTKYTQKEMLVYDATASAHAWQATATPPSTTIATVNNPITDWTGITLSQAAEMVSFGWQSESFGLPLNTPEAPPSEVRSYLVQTLSVAATPDESFAIPGVSYTASTSAASILAVPEGTAAANFFLDPSGGPFSATNPASGCHLRNYVSNFQEAPGLAGALSESWGRFMTPIDRIAVHPSGKVFGISQSISCFQSITLNGGGPDADAPIALLMSGPGTRSGLVTNPVSIVCAPNTAVYVLEAGDSSSSAAARVQAFDVDGNPCAVFDGSSCSFFNLRAQTASATYLDLSIEGAGYIYVLYYLNDGSELADYVLDVYLPDGSAVLCTTTGVPSSGIAVSLARDLYGLNYQWQTGTAGRTEPTISHWIPTPPPSNR